MTTSMQYGEEMAMALTAQLRGEVIRPTDPQYEMVRPVYNGMIDRYPALIIRCHDVADVISAVNFGRSQKMDVAIRGGGHNGGGLGTVDGGLVIDLSLMKGLWVNPLARTVRAEAGCTLGELDHATHAFGLATPSGILSTTGIAGLTLGGGLGHLTRKYGLTIDNLLEVDVVLADGRYVTANNEQNSDLFWAIRGGGGNFGVVTHFKYRLHPVNIIVGGPTLWEIEKAADVLSWYRDFILKAPPELNGFFAFLTVPPGPPFPEHLHNKKMCGIVWCHCGSKAEAEKQFADIGQVLEPALHGVHEMPYTALQSAFDALYPPGLQWYWRADFVNELSDEAIAEHVSFGGAMPTPLSSMHLYPIDGAAHEPATEATPWAYRDANWAQVIVGVDPAPEKATELRDWTVSYWEALHPHSAGGAYVNFMMEEGQERVRATYGANYARLAQIKKRYDPTNFFHVNQNIKPQG